MRLASPSLSRRARILSPSRLWGCCASEPKTSASACRRPCNSMEDADETQYGYRHHTSALLTRAKAVKTSRRDLARHCYDQEEARAFNASTTLRSNTRPSRDWRYLGHRRTPSSSWLSRSTREKSHLSFALIKSTVQNKSSSWPNAA